MFANGVHAKTMFVHISDREIFSPSNCSKFAVECDWNGKNFKTFRIRWWCLENKKITCFFLKKNLEIFQNREMWQFFSKCVSNGIISYKSLSTLFLRFFWPKFRKNIKLEKLENRMKSILKKKTLSSF